MERFNATMPGGKSPLGRSGKISKAALRRMMSSSSSLTLTGRGGSSLLVVLGAAMALGFRVT